jgi:hypothetical protein
MQAVQHHVIILLKEINHHTVAASGCGSARR